MIKFTFLGTSSAFPTKTRNHPSVYLELGGSRVLFDCGEGTQRQIRRAGLSPSVSDVFITHWHGDHSLGLGGIIQSLNMMGKSELRVYGPEGTTSSVRSLMSAYRFDKRIKVSAKAVKAQKETKVAEIGDYEVFALDVKHMVKCLAYKLKEKDRINIDPVKLKKYGIKPGPYLKALKEGKDVKVNGVKLRARDLTYLKRGKTLVYMTDFAYDDKLAKFARNADVLISESTFLSDMGDKAKKFMHLTVHDAIKLAKKSGSKKLFIIHTSQRYEGDSAVLDDINRQKALLKYSFDVVLPNDLDSFML